MNAPVTKNKMTIIFFSGTMDKAAAMLILATTAASMGMEVKVFFTFWGLNFLKKKRVFMKKTLLQRMMEFMTPRNRRDLPLSDLNMMGAGPAMMKRLMTATRMPSIDELTATALELGVKFIACSTSCGIMGLERGNMAEGVDEVAGAAAFLAEAREAAINLFI